MKTRQYTVIFTDGIFYHAVWGGNASSLRKHIEQETGLTVALIFKQIMKPLYNWKNK